MFHAAFCVPVSLKLQARQEFTDPQRLLSRNAAGSSFLGHSSRVDCHKVRPLPLAFVFKQREERSPCVINRVLRHNMRNKMGIITGYAEMLETRLSGEDAKKARKIKDTADQLLDLTESAQRLEEYRELSPDLEPIDIAPMLEDTVSELQMQYPEASVTIDAPDTVVVNTHERLKTALWEVVENAAEHGGDPPIVEIDVAVTETGVTIAVSDNGPGLPKVEQEVLESSMETPLVHGEGLGLSLIHWIVTSLTGDLETTIDSEGTTVTIRFPKMS